MDTHSLAAQFSGTGGGQAVADARSILCSGRGSQVRSPGKSAHEPTLSTARGRPDREIGRAKAAGRGDDAGGLVEFFWKRLKLRASNAGFADYADCLVELLWRRLKLRASNLSQDTNLGRSVIRGAPNSLSRTTSAAAGFMPTAEFAYGVNTPLHGRRSLRRFFDMDADSLATQSPDPGGSLVVDGPRATIASGSYDLMRNPADSSQESKLETARLLPDPAICRAKSAGFSDYADCLVEGRTDCRHATPFGHGCFCLHPQRNEIVMRTSIRGAQEREES